MFRRTETEDVDYRSFYHLESYLERTVKARFDRDGELSAFDFFCIVIWKANRAKTKVATRLLRATSNDLDGAARELTRAIAAAPTKRRKMEVLVKEWKFRLPMASAILSVLYPKDFTVYDVRVCNVLGGFRSLQNKTSMDSIWTEYESFVEAARGAAPSRLTLRDKDRWLWGKSFCEQLQVDVQTGFNRAT